MKERHPDTGWAETAAEYRHHDKRAKYLGRQSDLEYKACHLDESTDLMGRNAVLEDAALEKRDLASRDHRYERRHGNDPQAADLDHYQNDRLAKRGPVCGRVPYDKSGDANG